jgi:predicted NAD/FAD-binding protein
VKLAIVGAGISGLTAAWRLAPEHEIAVFEATDHAGGHAHTARVRLGQRELDVDTGFIVYNEQTYPSFTRMLAELGVATQPTDMSFSVRCEATGLEYGGHSLAALFAQPRNLLRPGFLRMLRDVPRFWRDARRLLETEDEKVTLGEFAGGRGYSREFVEWHLLPMGGAIWSTDCEAMREFPALAFARFFANHGLLQLRDRPEWRTVAGGSRCYVEKLVAGFRGRIHLRTPVRAIRRDANGVDLFGTRGSLGRFDRVVIAAHADQALRMLADPTDPELRVLGAIRYAPNEAVLHTDASLLPRRRAARASWNHHLLPGRRGQAAVTYDLSRLQRLDAPEPLLVTLNRTQDIDPSRVLRRILYHHPQFDGAALRAQRLRGAIDGRNRTHYCGAYWYDGFHEDGVESGLDVVRAIAEARR